MGAQSLCPKQGYLCFDLGVNWVLRAGAQSKVTCVLIWVWTGCSELVPKARLPVFWFGCELGAQSSRPKQGYLCFDLGVKWVLRAHAQSKVTCALVWVWTAGAQSKVTCALIWVWNGCLRPKQVYLYSGGMFILMSSTDDTKYIPCNRAIDASALILHRERKSVKWLWGTLIKW